MSDSPAVKRFLPQPVETSVKTSRRFAVEPVETSTRSNRTSENDSKSAKDTSTEKPKRRFAPEPIETSVKSNRNQAVNSATDVTPKPSSGISTTTEEPKPRRRFTPQLIETVQRTKRQGDTTPATLPTDKTDITPGTKHIYLPKQKPKGPFALLQPLHSTLNGSEAPIPHLYSLQAPRRQPSMRPHFNSRRSTRTSYRNSLEVIESSESSGGEHEEVEEMDDIDDVDEMDGVEEVEEVEDTPSLSGSYESSADSQRLQLARTRESCDDRFSGYLLALAAKAAEKQLREQADAAFPNSDFHEIVEHFYQESDDDPVEGVGILGQDDDDEAIQMIRRQPTEVGWAAKEMQQHQEKLEQFREEKTQEKIAATAHDPSFKDPFWTNGQTFKLAQANVKDDELRKMRNAASPPMLGGDLKFRMCPSPQATKFETDQKFDIHPDRADDGGGLWGGYCVAKEADQWLSPAITQGPAMIHTPHQERDDPFATAFATETSVSPGKSPGKKATGVHMVAGLDSRAKAQVAKSKLQDDIEREFDDKFVTQVFNYLSLGYPLLARPYDEELSKITGVPEEELCKDDEKKDVQGYMGVHVEGRINVESITEGHSARWKALKVYILEWARQHPDLSNGAADPSAWGVRARRGSWAI